MTRLCILGGSLTHRGGLEAFCERGLAAIGTLAPEIDAIWIPTQTAYPSLRGSVEILKALLRCMKHHRKVDLVWLQLSNLGDLVFLALFKGLGKKVLVTPHFGANSHLQRISWRRHLVSSLLGASDRIALLFDAQASEIALPSGVARETLGSFLPQSAFQSEPSRIHDEDTDRHDLQLIHAGRFLEEKGTLSAIEIVAELHRRQVPCHLRLIGRGDDHMMGLITHMIERDALQDHVEIVPWVAPDRMHSVLQDADVLLHLSRLDSFPLIVLEALAAGALPIIWPMPGSGSMVSQFGGYAVPGKQPAQEAAQWICSQPVASLRKNGLQASASVQQAFAWPNIVKRLQGIFSRTLEG